MSFPLIFRESESSKIKIIGVAHAVPDDTRWPGCRFQICRCCTVVRFHLLGATLCMNMSAQEVGYIPFIMEGTTRLLALRSICKFSVRINHFSVYLIFSHKKVQRG